MMCTCPRRAAPHDVRSGLAMGCRQSCCFRIEGPHDHPVRADGDGWARFVIGIGIAALSGTCGHVGDPRNSVGRPGLMSREISRPPHRRFVSAHRMIADHVGVVWHASEAVGACAQNYGVPLRVLVDDSCCAGDFGWPSRHGPFDSRLCRLSCINSSAVSWV